MDLDQLNDVNFALLHLFYLAGNYPDRFAAVEDFKASEFYNSRNPRFATVVLTNKIKHKK